MISIAKLYPVKPLQQVNSAEDGLPAEQPERADQLELARPSQKTFLVTASQPRLDPWRWRGTEEGEERLTSAQRLDMDYRIGKMRRRILEALDGKSVLFQANNSFLFLYFALGYTDCNLSLVRGNTVAFLRCQGATVVAISRHPRRIPFAPTWG